MKPGIEAGQQGAGNHSLIIAQEHDAFARPEVAPGESSCQDGEQLLPLDRLALLVWLPGVMEPAAL